MKSPRKLVKMFSNTSEIAPLIRKLSRKIFSAQPPKQIQIRAFRAKSQLFAGDALLSPFHPASSALRWGRFRVYAAVTIVVLTEDLR